ncbi:hypothetical protein [Nostoc favosum]|uniref:CpcA n=1 Tax=Nostoc favosum CHAB5714 TaxID=2780399 RepID=A0ABS8I8P3_9NOSO|nr:hypothetical protein [Nostoc favosum]MCC5600549.1 hypothetical protein [Nostoc favosum CHAB5714]
MPTATRSGVRPTSAIAKSLSFETASPRMRATIGRGVHRHNRTLSKS